MTRPRMNLTGHRYGKLTVLRLARAPVPGRRTHWTARCDCGQLCERSLQSLRQKTQTPMCDSCRQQWLIEKKTTHNETGSPLHTLWSAHAALARRQQKNRGPDDNKPPHMHPEWVKSYQAFADWIRDNIGDRPGPGWNLARIDRTRGREPGNLEWRPTTKVREQLERDRAAGANQTYSPPTRCTASAGTTWTRAPAQARI